MITTPYKCQHGFMLPGDGWIMEREWQKLLSGHKTPTKFRVAHCRLCKERHVQLFEYGRWKSVNQLEFSWQ